MFHKHLEDLVCPVCYSNYNQDINAPRVLINCGHTICTECLRIILNGEIVERRCPLDQRQFDMRLSIINFPVNFVLIHLLEASTNHGLCIEHKRPLRFLCLADHMKTCDDCVIFGSHRDHEVKLLSEIKQNAQDNQSKLKDALNKLDKQQEEICSVYHDNEHLLRRHIKTSFDDLKVTINKKQAELDYFSKFFIRSESNEANEYLEEATKRRKCINKEIGVNERMLEEDDYVAMMNQDISNITSKADPLIQDEKLKSLKNEVNEKAKSLSEFLRSVFEASAKQLDFSFEQAVVKIAESFEKITLRSCFEIFIKKNCLIVELRDEKLKNIQLCTKEIMKLKKVKIELLELNDDMNDYRDQNNEALEYIYKILGKRASFKIRFCPHIVFKYYVFKLFPVIFCGVKEVEELEICFENCKIRDKGMDELFGVLTHKLPFVKKLTLNLSSTHISNKSLDSLAYVLSTIGNLKTLNIELYNVNVTDDGVIQIFSEIETVSELYLHLQETHVTDATLQAFVCFALPNIKDLQRLTFCLGNTQISDQGVTKLFKNLKSMRSLVLGLAHTNITNDSVEAFLEKAPSLSSALSFLDIDLSETQIEKSYMSKVAEIQKVINGRMIKERKFD